MAIPGPRYSAYAPIVEVFHFQSDESPISISCQLSLIEPLWTVSRAPSKMFDAVFRPFDRSVRLHGEKACYDNEFDYRGLTSEASSLRSRNKSQFC